MVDCGLISDIKKISGSKIFTDELKKIADSVSKNNVSVLISGERGVGKKLFAQYIHFLGSNPDNSFYCYKGNWKELVSLVSDNNFLSGHITVFFNRIETLPLDLQNKLVFLIKETGFNHKNIRFIFSTQESLDEKIEQNLFSKDLYFLISTVLVNMIPLRHRKEDILDIAEALLNEYKDFYTYDSQGFSETAKSDIMNYFWAGNLAELRNAVERGIICASGPLIQSKDMALQLGNDTGFAQDVVLEYNDTTEDKSLKTALDSFKKAYLIKILEENNWNQTKTAKVLGIQRTYVIRLINELQIRKK